MPELITKARTDAGLTMQQLSERAKGRFKRANISQWESGKNRPTIENIELLVEALGVTYDEISLPLDDLKARRYEFPKFFLHRVK